MYQKKKVRNFGITLSIIVRIILSCKDNFVSSYIYRNDIGNAHILILNYASILSVGDRRSTPSI
jgi:predicted tellurium resistance membrane protein TerC